MTTKQFTDTLKAMAGVPTEVKEELIELAGSLSEDDQERILLQLQGIGADMQKNEQAHSSALKRQDLMLRQIEEHDMPIVDSLIQDA